MTQTNLFESITSSSLDSSSLDSGLALKAEGQAKVEEHNRSFVQHMRDAAHAFASMKGTVTSDDLRAYADEYGLAASHRNAWGAVFNSPMFQAVGYTRSKLPSNHARTIRVWALR